jgi:proline racemase
MRIKNLITTIDTHTAGGPTRIITNGIPHLDGRTVLEKMECFKKKYDHLRQLLMYEPRGHEGMFGAVLTEPAQTDADIGVFFLTHSGYLNMCVHSAVGVVTACLETGIMPESARERPIQLDTPAGVISLEATYDGGILKSVAIRTNPGFVHTEEEELDIGYKHPVKVGLVFSGVFFVLLEVEQVGMQIRREEIPNLTSLGIKVLEAANKTFQVQHPDNPDINSFEMAMLYEEIEKSRARNAVVSCSGSLDRSPCGAGTGAKMAYLLARGKLRLNENYVNESVYGTKFRGSLVEAVNVGPYSGAVPKVIGSAYVTGFHRFVLDKDDSLTTGL